MFVLEAFKALDEFYARFWKLSKQVKDDQIEELTREIQMYYGINRHIEELTKENQVIINTIGHQQGDGKYDQSFIPQFHI